MILNIFYILVAICVCFVVLSLAVVRAHERKLAEKAERTPASDGLPEEQEDEFFTSPIYKAMSFIAHM